MNVLRVIDTGVRSACWNIGVSAALAEMHRAGRIPDTIRFHRYPRSVLLGHSQAIDQVVDTTCCALAGIEIARRVTGGGAVYMDPGMLAWDLVIDRSRFGLSIADVSERICAMVVTALSCVGLSARFAPPGNILIDGCKVSGSSGLFDGPSLLHQGTILLDFDRAAMSAVLKAPSNVVPSAQVAGLAEFLDRIPTSDEMEGLLIDALCEALGTSAQIGEMTDSEIALADRLLREEIGTSEFIMGDAGGTEPAPAFHRQGRSVSQ